MATTRELLGTGVMTSAVGFGCAGLFRIPGREARRWILDSAYDAGIRHFDVAPMYGLGSAEAELASFLKSRRDNVTITTKFGIDPTPFARGVAHIQHPLRAILAKRPNVGAGLKAATKGPRSGLLGRLLYSSPGYHRQSAQASLERSLRILGTDYVDVFLLHDPTGGLARTPDLADYLDEQRCRGRLRCWGVTGQPSELTRAAKYLARTTVIQFRDDIFEKPISVERAPGGARITYGALARTVPVFRQFLARSPGAVEKWSERLGIDFAEESSLPRMLLGSALRRNTAGPVLFTTTRAERVVVAVEAAAQGSELSDFEVTAFGELATAVQAAFPEKARTP